MLQRFLRCFEMKKGSAMEIEITVRIGRKNIQEVTGASAEISVETKISAVPIFVSAIFFAKKVEEYFRDVRITNQVTETIWTSDKIIGASIMSALCKKKVSHSKNFLLTKVVTSLN